MNKGIKRTRRRKMRTRNLFYRVVTVMALLAMLLPQGAGVPARSARAQGPIIFTERITASNLDSPEPVYATEFDSDGGGVDVLEASANADDITRSGNDGGEHFAQHAISPSAVAGDSGSTAIIINEVLPNPDEGDYEWVELHYASSYSMVYLPLILKNSSGGATSAGESRLSAGAPAALADPVDISGWQITDEDGNIYTVPASLPAVPPEGYVLIHFDGQGATADDYDFSDGVAVLHTPSGLVDILDDEADQVALYASGTPNPDSIRDFVAYGGPPGEDATNAVAASLWQSSWRVSMHIGSGAVLEGAEAVPNRSIGLYPGHTNDSPNDWAVFEGNDITPGAANPVPRAYWSTVADGTVMGSDGFALGWSLMPGATYHFQMDDDSAFGSPLVDVTLDGPFYEPNESVPAGNYWWRVRAIDTQNRASAWSEPASVGVVAVTGAHAAGDEVNAQAVLQQEGVPMTWLRQRKDTRLLCIDGDDEGNPDDTGPEEAWDSPHPDDRIYTHGDKNCVRASIAMIASRYGGSLSQDYLSYILFENWGNPIQDEDGVGDPSVDLGHYRATDTCGIAGSKARELMAWALGVPWYEITYSGEPTGFFTKPSFDDDIRPWIDARRPIMIMQPHPDPAKKDEAHAVVIRGYRVLADGTEEVHIYNPWKRSRSSPDPGIWVNYSDVDIYCYYVPPAEAPNVRSDPAAIGTDSSDSDGVMDWDEQNRFGTPANRLDSTSSDSDDDEVEDKKDIREYVFDKAGNYNPHRSDWDGDGDPKEVDDDNDGGGAVDGCEDFDHDGRFDPGETSNFYAADDIPCVPVMDQVYTTDYWFNSKDTFRPGEAIRLVLVATNHGHDPIDVTYDWDTYDPTGARVSYLSWNDWAVSMPPGEDSWWLTRGIASNARLETYTYIATVSYASGTSAGSWPFVVQGDPISINLLEALTCKDVQNDLPVDVTDTFTTDDAYVYAWTAWEGASGPHTILWEWYRPNGTLFGTYSYDFNTTYSLYYVWSWLSVSCVGDDLGQWSVRFYVDGAYKGTRYFTIAAGTQSQTGDQLQLFTPETGAAGGASLPILQPASAPVKAGGD
jgi:hypothetical protein